MQPEELHSPRPSRGMRVEAVDSFSSLDHTIFRGPVVRLDDYNVFTLRDTSKRRV